MAKHLEKVIAFLTRKAPIKNMYLRTRMNRLDPENPPECPTCVIGALVMNLPKRLRTRALKIIQGPAGVNRNGSAIEAQPMQDLRDILQTYYELSPWQLQALQATNDGANHQKTRQRLVLERLRDYAGRS